MKRINPEHISALISTLNRGPFFKHLDMKFCELGIAYSRVELDIQKKHCNPFGSVHGGVYASLIDSAAYMAIYCEQDENTGYTTLDLSINNLAMVRDGKLIAEGKTIKIGHSICLAEVNVKNDQGKLLAYGVSKLMILSGQQAGSNCVDLLGNKPLPPKFI